MKRQFVLFSLTVSVLPVGVEVECVTVCAGDVSWAAKDRPSTTPTNSQPVTASSQPTNAEAADVNDFLDLFKRRRATDPRVSHLHGHDGGAMDRMVADAINCPRELSASDQRNPMAMAGSSNRRNSARGASKSIGSGVIR